MVVGLNMNADDTACLLFSSLILGKHRVHTLVYGRFSSSGSW